MQILHKDGSEWQWKNNLAYYNTATVRAVKSFIVQAPVVKKGTFKKGKSISCYQQVELEQGHRLTDGLMDGQNDVLK